MIGPPPTNVQAATVRRSRSVGRDFLALTKPGIVLGNVLMTATGLALAPSAPWTVVLAALLGTAALIASSGAFNMLIERDVDTLMARTRDRPTAQGRIRGPVAAAFGTLLLVVGAMTLAEFTTLIAAGLGIAAFVIYVAVYTPLKKRSFVAIPVGAVAGALPPVIGWFAAGGAVSWAAALLFSAIFVWQIPHFMAIGIRLSKEYRDAGLRIGADPQNLRASVNAIRVTTIALQFVTIATVTAVDGGFAFMLLGTIAALVMLAAVLRKADDPVLWSRRVFLASLAYLPAFALGAFIPY